MTLSSAPPVDDSRSSLRRSLGQALCDGVANEVITAITTGAVLSAWAMYLKAGTFLVGLVTAFPLLAQVLQVPAAQLIDRWGRRRVAIVGFFVRAQAYLPLVVLPWLETSSSTKRLVLITSSLVSAVAGVLANTAWASWMGELLPQRVRGRFYGARYSLAMLGSGVASLVAGLGLDLGAHQGGLGPALSAVALAICVSGCVSTWSLLRQPDTGRQAAMQPFSWHALLEPLRDRAARRYLVFQALWNSAIACSGGFVAMHMAVNLGLSFRTVAAQGLVAALCRVATSSFWGRMVDRFGARPVLLFSCIGITSLPLIQCLATPQAPWPIWVEAVVSGTAWAANVNAVFCLPYRLAPVSNRTSYLAVFTAIAGLANGLTATVAGAVADALPQRVSLGTHWLFDIQVLFIVGLMMRAAATLYGLRIVEQGSRGTRALLIQLKTDVVSSTLAAARPLARVFLR